MKEKYAEELYQALKNLLDTIPIIAGDSRHDELALRIHEADKLIQEIEKDEYNVDSTPEEAIATRNIRLPEKLNPYLWCSVKAGTTNGSVGHCFPYSRYETADSHSWTPHLTLAMQ